MSDNSSHHNKKLEDMLKEEILSSSCFQELTFNLTMKGYDLTDSAYLSILRKMFKWLDEEESLNVINMSENENITTLATFIREMFSETDVVTAENAAEFAPLVCRVVLYSRYKKNLMDVFRIMCQRFPRIMVDEYNRQKTVKSCLH